MRSFPVTSRERSEPPLCGVQVFCRAKSCRRRNSLSPRMFNHTGLPNGAPFGKHAEAVGRAAYCLGQTSGLSVLRSFPVTSRERSEPPLCGVQVFCRAKSCRRRNSLSPRMFNHTGLPNGAPFGKHAEAAGRAAYCLGQTSGLNFLSRYSAAESTDRCSPLCYFCIGQTRPSFQPSESMID